MKLGLFTKSLLVLFTLGIVAFFAWIPISAYFADLRIRRALDKWAIETNRFDSNGETFGIGLRLIHPDNPFQKPIAFTVHTAAIDARGEYEAGIGLQDGKWFLHAEDPKRFYVMPSKKWVDTTNEVMSTWNHEFEKYAERGFQPEK